MIDCHLCFEVYSDPAQRRPASDGYLCAEHLASVRQVLLDVDRWFAHVESPEFLRTTVDRDTERWVGSRAPLDTQAVCVLDRRTRTLVSGDPVSPERVLRAWAYAMNDNHPADEYGFRDYWAHDRPMPRMSMTALVSVHLAFLDWTVAQPSVVRYARHMAAVRRQLERLIPGF